MYQTDLMETEWQYITKMLNLQARHALKRVINCGCIYLQN